MFEKYFNSSSNLFDFPLNSSGLLLFVLIYALIFILNTVLVSVDLLGGLCYTFLFVPTYEPCASCSTSDLFRVDLAICTRCFSTSNSFHMAPTTATEFSIDCTLVLKKLSIGDSLYLSSPVSLVLSSLLRQRFLSRSLMVLEENIDGICDFSKRLLSFSEGSSQLICWRHFCLGSVTVGSSLDPLQESIVFFSCLIVYKRAC